MVAPPTCVGEQRWRVTHEAAVLRLDQAEADALMRFVALWRLRCAGGPVEVLVRERDEVSPLNLTEAVLQGWYRKLARRGGRNQALFKAASLARDSGWSEAQGCAALVLLHVAQPPTGHAWVGDAASARGGSAAHDPQRVAKAAAGLASGARGK